MKLRKLAIAVAAASFSLSAQAYELDITGDLNVGYFHNSDESPGHDRAVQEEGSELNIDIKTEKMNGITFMGHVEIDAEGLLEGDAGFAIQELRAGAKGKFGEIWFGDVQDACEKLQKGGDYHKFLGVSSQGCTAENEGTILYWKPFKWKVGDTKREIRAGVSYNPTRDTKTVGLRYKHKKGMEFAIGYQDINDPSDTSRSGLYANASATVAFGPVEVKTRINEKRYGETQWSLQSKYTFGNNAIYGGLEDDDTTAIGYRRQFGRSAFIIEARDDVDNGFDKSELEYAIGISTEWK